MSLALALLLSGCSSGGEESNAPTTTAAAVTASSSTTVAARLKGLRKAIWDLLLGMSSYFVSNAVQRHFLAVRKVLVLVSSDLAAGKAILLKSD